MGDVLAYALCFALGGLVGILVVLAAVILLLKHPAWAIEAITRRQAQRTANLNEDTSDAMTRALRGAMVPPSPEEGLGVLLEDVHRSDVDPLAKFRTRREP